jgi:hypothetical protein
VEVNAHLPHPDVLSQVLGLLQLQGKVFCRCEFAAPWGIAFPAQWAHFHVVERGECWLHPAGETQPVRLSAGDLVVLPRGTGHRLGSSSRVKFAAIDKVVAKQRQHPQQVLRYGGGGAHTHVVCGTFTSDAISGRPLLASLPTILHLPGQAGKALAWLCRE